MFETYLEHYESAIEDAEAEEEAGAGKDVEAMKGPKMGIFIAKRPYALNQSLTSI